jgi:phospholipase/carboxylesterase
MKARRFGELRVRLTGGPDGEGGGDGPLVVLLHGFGAPGTDLVPLARVMNLPERIRVAFPEAPLELPGAYGGGRAWWMLDMAKLQRAMIRGVPRDLRQERPEELPAARAKLTATLDALTAELGVAEGELVLGGFSQGAMLSCDQALHSDRPLAGLVQLSGAYLNEDDWAPRFAARKGLPVFQSHGRRDPILGFAGAEHLRAAMDDAGWDVRFTAFGGAHEIPMEVLAGLAAFIDERLG